MQSINHGSIWSMVLLRLRQDWRQIFAIHLVYTLLGFVLFTPLIAGVSRLLLRFSNQPALADQDIIWFLLSPAGIVALVLMTGLMITIFGIEQASLIAMGAGGKVGSPISVMAVFRHTAAHAARVFSFAIMLVLRLLLLILPFLAVAGAIAWFLLTDYDINYYLSEQPAEYWVAVVMIGLVLLAMLIMLVSKLLAWSMALPLVLFTGVKPADSFAESIRFTNGHKTRLTRALLLWALLAVVLSIIVSAAVQQLGSWVVPNFFDSISWLVPVVGGFIALWVFGNFLVTVFTAGSFAYLLVAFYERPGSGFDGNLFTSSAPEQSGRSFKITARKLTLMLALVTISAILVGHWLMNGIRINDSVTVVAHRGAAGKAPENTIASVRQAIADGADWVEIDVQETADGEVVVIHDSDFMKLAGVNLKVWEGTLEQMRGIDIGSWFDPQFSAERIPTLAEVLEEVKGKAGLVIELKYYGHDQQLEQRVVDIVERSGMVDDIAIMSLKYEGIQKISALRPDWTCGLLSVTAIGNLARLDVDFLAVAKGMATPGFVHRSHAQGKQVFVWTINDAVTMSRMMSLGVDGIITDEPALARDVMADRADLNSAERLLMHTAILFGTPEPQRIYRDDSP